MRNVILEVLVRAGFIINWKKCIIDPSLIMTALGFTLNFSVVPATITPSPKRVMSTTQIIQDILRPKNPSATPRGICSVGGKIGSDRFVNGAAANLHCRFLYKFVTKHVNGKKGWDSTHTLSSLQIEELQYWVEVYARR